MPTQVVALVCGAILVIIWGLFCALLLESSLWGVSVVCLFILGFTYTIGLAVNQMGARLAAVTEQINIDLLESMKGHLLDRMSTAGHNKFFEKARSPLLPNALTYYSLITAHTAVLTAHTARWALVTTMLTVTCQHFVDCNVMS